MIEIILLTIGALALFEGLILLLLPKTKKAIISTLKNSKKAELTELIMGILLIIIGFLLYTL